MSFEAGAPGRAGSTSFFLSRLWLIEVLRGIVAILVGVCALIWPGDTAAALVLVFVAVAVVDGTLALDAALAGQAVTPGWWILLLQGVLGIGVGALTLLRPTITKGELLAGVAAWAIGLGVLRIVAVVELRGGRICRWWLALGGILSLGFGGLLAWRPSWAPVLLSIALYALGWGLSMVIGGFEIRREYDHVDA